MIVTTPPDSMRVAPRPVSPEDSDRSRAQQVEYSRAAECLAAELEAQGFVVERLRELRRRGVGDRRTLPTLQSSSARTRCPTEPSPSGRTMSSSSDPTIPELAMRRLTSRGTGILAFLLSDDFPGRDELSLQLDGLECRTVDADGSLELRVRLGVQRAPVARRIPTEGHTLDEDGIMVHVLLHVVDGFMSELEIYRDDSTPPRRPIDPATLELGYAETPSADE